MEGESVISKTVSEDESLVYAHDNGIAKVLGIYRRPVSKKIAVKDRKYVPEPA